MSQMITDVEVIAAEVPVETAWADEVRRRVSDYRAGRAITRPIDEVLNEVDEMLR